MVNEEETTIGEKIRTEGKVEGLGWEVSDDVGSVSSPEREETLFTVCTRKSITDTLVWGSKTTLLNLCA